MRFWKKSTGLMATLKSDQEESALAGLKSLIISRKFWVTVLSDISAVALYVHGKMDADHLATFLSVTSTALVLGMAHEDHGKGSSDVTLEKSVAKAESTPTGDSSSVTTTEVKS